MSYRLTKYAFKAIIHAIKVAWLISAAVEEASTPGVTDSRRYHLSDNELWGVGAR